MITNTASRTALGAAMFRAAHQLVDHPPVFIDPLALRILGAGVRGPSCAPPASAGWAAARPRCARSSPCAAGPARITSRRRTRAACASYVVVGAGLDTFRVPPRLSRARRVRDRSPGDAGRQAGRGSSKRSSRSPRRVTLAPIDFEHETLRDGPRRARRRRLRPAGVLHLARRHAVPHARGDPPDPGRDRQRRAGQRARARLLRAGHRRARPSRGAPRSSRGVAELGEPFRSEIAPRRHARRAHRGRVFSRRDRRGPPRSTRAISLIATMACALRGGHMAHAWV